MIWSVDFKGFLFFKRSFAKRQIKRMISFEETLLCNYLKIWSQCAGPVVRKLCNWSYRFHGKTAKAECEHDSNSCNVLFGSPHPLWDSLISVSLRVPAPWNAYLSSSDNVLVLFYCTKCKSKEQKTFLGESFLFWRKIEHEESLGECVNAVYLRKYTCLSESQFPNGSKIIGSF